MKEKEWKGVRKRTVLLVLYLLLCSVLWILAISRARHRGAGWGRRGRSFHLSVPSTWLGLTKAVYLLNKRLQLGVQGLKPAGQSSNQRAVCYIRQLWNLGIRKYSFIPTFINHYWKYGGTARFDKWDAAAATADGWTIRERYRYSKISEAMMQYVTGKVSSDISTIWLIDVWLKKGHRENIQYKVR